MPKRLAIAAILLTLGIASAGCANLTPVYVLDQDEIVMLEAGQTFTPKTKGAFYSDQAQRRIMEAKIEKKVR